jgi:shikimate kinase
MDQMRCVFLVGFMGSGKSSVGAAVAARLDSQFIDLDEEISRQLGAPIAEIFGSRGESTFRAAESDALATVAGMDEVVVATGGGAFCSEGNREIIHGSGGVSVYLDLPWSELHRRLARDHSQRPMYANPDQAAQLFEQRRPQYLQAMVRVVLDGSEGPDDVADRVVDALQEVPCAT